jgi:hypothetical protein
MPSTWAPNDWVSGDLLIPTYMNNIGNSIRTWGYGETAGTVTINANQNHIAAMGQLAFHSSGYVNVDSVPLTLTDGVLSSSSGAESLSQWVNCPTGGSAQHLEILGRRTSAGTDHDTAALRIRRRVDAVNMGFLDFSSTTVSLGYGASTFASWSSVGQLTEIVPSVNAANDATAAAGGVPVGGRYRNGSVVMIRIS